MKELELKLKELEDAKKCCERCIESNKQDMEKVKDENYETYLNIEFVLQNNLAAKRDIERKINIINDAMDILEGIE